jgi:hypothetical protein
LPIRIERVYQVTYTAEELTYSEREVAEMALLRLRHTLLSTVGDGTLLEKELTGVYTETGYLLTCRIVYLTNIAKSLAFSVDNQ